METVLVGRSRDGVTELGGPPPIYGCYYLCLAQKTPPFISSQMPAWLSGSSETQVKNMSMGRLT